MHQSNPATPNPHAAQRPAEPASAGTSPEPSAAPVPNTPVSLTPQAVPGLTLDPEGMPPGRPLRPDWEISPTQVAKLWAQIHAGEVLLLDCRTEREFEIARIDPARLIPLQQIAQRIDELADYADKPVITFCHHGMRSLQMASILRNAGFTDARSMAGGIDLWSLTVDPSTPRY